MAPPPKYLIQRKLIKSIFKKVVPKKPLIPIEYYTKLSECWRVHGIGSQKCADEELMFNFAETETLSYRKRIEDLGLRELIMGEIKRPVYHRQVKGRGYSYRKKFQNVTDFLKYI